MMNELRDIAAALDPSVFARTIDFQPDEWQEKVLRWGGRRLLLNCSRQSGKSTLCASTAIHEAIYRPGSLTLLLSPGLRQSSELFMKVRGFMRRLPQASDLATDNKLSTELRNGSRIVGLPGTEATIRGYSGVSLVIIDEASRVEDPLYLSTRPMLAVSNGRLILASTPFGRRGFFYEAWANGGPEWERVEVPAEKCPRISKEFLEEEIGSLGAYWYDQEYRCQFKDAVDSVFPLDLVRAALDPNLQPLFPDRPSAPETFSGSTVLFPPASGRN